MIIDISEFNNDQNNSKRSENICRFLFVIEIRSSSAFNRKKKNNNPFSFDVVSQSILLNSDKVYETTNQRRKKHENLIEIKSEIQANEFE